MVYPLMSTALLTLTRGITGIGVSDYVRALAPILGATTLMAIAVLLIQGGMGPDAAAALRLVAAVAGGIAAYTGAIWVLARRSVLEDVGRLWLEFRG
jgi:hypothetical protein